MNRNIYYVAAGAVVIISLIALTYSLRAGTMATGPRGLPGPMGPEGPIGTQGIQGVQGIQGPAASWETIPDKPDFHPVALSGSYNDLIHKPTPLRVYEVGCESDSYTFENETLEAVVVSSLKNRHTQSPNFVIGTQSLAAGGFGITGEFWGYIHDENRPGNTEHWVRYRYDGFLVSGSSAYTGKVTILDSSDGDLFNGFYRILAYASRLDVPSPNPETTDAVVSVQVTLFRKFLEIPILQLISLKTTGFLSASTLP